MCGGRRYRCGESSYGDSSDSKLLLLTVEGVGVGQQVGRQAGAGAHGRGRGALGLHSQPLTLLHKLTQDTGCYPPASSVRSQLTRHWILQMAPRLAENTTRMRATITIVNITTFIEKGSDSSGAGSPVSGAA